MAKVDPAAYILVSQGTVMASSDSVEELTGLFEKYRLPDGAIKPFRLHTWIDGIPDSIFSDEHCAHCKATRQRNGRTDDWPCKYPERGDASIEIIEHHEEHTKDKCCVKHNHHAEGMHVNCLFR